jgi:hypothetical protein
VVSGSTSFTFGGDGLNSGTDVTPDGVLAERKASLARTLADFETWFSADSSRGSVERRETCAAPSLTLETGGPEVQMVFGDLDGFFSVGNTDA